MFAGPCLEERKKMAFFQQAFRQDVSRDDGAGECLIRRKEDR